MSRSDSDRRVDVAPRLASLFELYIPIRMTVQNRRFKICKCRAVVLEEAPRSVQPARRVRSFPCNFVAQRSRFSFNSTKKKVEFDSASNYGPPIALAASTMSETTKSCATLLYGISDILPSPLLSIPQLIDECKLCSRTIKLHFLEICRIRILA